MLDSSSLSSTLATQELPRLGTMNFSTKESKYSICLGSDWTDSKWITAYIETKSEDTSSKCKHNGNTLYMILFIFKGMNSFLPQQFILLILEAEEGNKEPPIGALIAAHSLCLEQESHVPSQHCQKPSKEIIRTSMSAGLQKNNSIFIPCIQHITKNIKLTHNIRIIICPSH